MAAGLRNVIVVGGSYVGIVSGRGDLLCVLHVGVHDETLDH